jgi:hypothetical protein
MATPDPDPPIANPQPGTNPGYAEAQPRNRAEARQPTGAAQPGPGEPAKDRTHPPGSAPHGHP